MVKCLKKKTQAEETKKGEREPNEEERSKDDEISKYGEEKIENLGKKNKT